MNIFQNYGKKSNVSEPENEKNKISMEIDSEELKDLIARVREGNKIIGDRKEAKGILIIGETGVGKSTLTYLFAGKRLKVITSETKDFVLDLLASSDYLDHIDISHKKVSQTIIPGKVKHDGNVIWDCPGFGDIGRNATQDIANGFYIQRLFETSDELKFVLVLPEYHTKARGQDAVRVIEHFASMFESVKELKESVCLLVTQVPKEKKQGDIKKTLMSIMEDNKRLDPKAKELMGYFCEKIEIFYALTEPGILENKHYSTFIQSIKQKVKFLQTKTNKINIVVSQRSVPLAEKLFKITYENLSEEIDQLQEALINNCCENCQISEQIDEYFFKSELEITLLENKPHLRDYVTVMSLVALGNNFSDMIEKIDKLGFDNCFSKLNKSIQSTLKIIGHFNGGHNPFVNANEREFFEEKIKETSNQLRFLLKILKAQSFSLFLKETINKFAFIKEKLSNIIGIKARKMEICKTEMNSLYYEKIILFLTHFEEDSNVARNISIAHLCCSKLSFQKKLITDALINGINSYLYWVGNTEAIEFLDKIFEEYKDQLKMLKTENQTEIITELFELNNKKMNILLESANQEILKFLAEPEKNEMFDFIGKGYVILKKLSILAQTPISSNITIAIELINSCLEQCNSENQLRINLMNEADYMQKIYDLSVKSESAAKIEKWVNYFLFLEKIKSLLYVKTKEISSNQQNYNEEQLRKIIFFTSFEMKIDDQLINTSKDPVYIMIQNDAYYQLGATCLQNRNYEEAEKFFIHCIEIDCNYDLAYKGLETLYFKNNNHLKTENTTILERLFEFSIKHFGLLFQKHVILVLDDYVGDRKFFNPLKNESEFLEYLESVLNICSMVQNFDKDADFNIYLKDFFQFLSEIKNKLKNQANFDCFEEEFKKHPKLICETVSESSEFMGISLLEKQINYSIWLENVKLKKNQNFSRGILFENIDMINLTSFYSKLREKTAHMEISLKETDPKYYIKINELTKKIWDNNKMILKDTSICCMRLGDILMCDKNKEAVKYYQDALEQTEQFFNFCEKENHLDLYKQFARKREIAQKLGNLHFSMENYHQAFNVYKKINDYLRIKECLKRLKPVSQNDATFIEEKGDYYCGIGLIEKSVASYHEARVLSKKVDDVVRLYKKIAIALESYKKKIIVKNKKNLTKFKIEKKNLKFEKDLKFFQLNKKN